LRHHRVTIHAGQGWQLEAASLRIASVEADVADRGERREGTDPGDSMSACGRGETGAGILRAKPGTIKWAKDRGKEPMRSKEEFPWFWGWDENDLGMNPSDPTRCANFGAPTDITVDQGQKPRYDPVPAGVIYDGNRWNDLHYTRAAKEAARARQEGKQS
jgi:hypothetical protein